MINLALALNVTTISLLLWFDLFFFNYTAIHDNTDIEFIFSLNEQKESSFPIIIDILVYYTSL